MLSTPAPAQVLRQTRPGWYVDNVSCLVDLEWYVKIIAWLRPWARRAEFGVHIYAGTTRFNNYSNSGCHSLLTLQEYT